MPTTRFAPSPTGLLHLGHAFSALYSFEKSDGGRFVVRLEDIDRGRCKTEFAEAIYEDLAWLGISWAQSVRRQSEHFDDYSRALEKLNAMGLLYPCFCTRGDIKNALNAPHGPEGVVYPRTCLRLTPLERSDRIASGEAYSLRLDMETAASRVGAISWFDEERGSQIAQPYAFGDVILARKDTPASYHLCVTVDDALQEIELVTRGEDLFHATDIHRLLQELLELPVPHYSHHRLILNDQGEKYSKRDQSITLRSLRESGETAQSIRQRFQI